MRSHTPKACDSTKNLNVSISAIAITRYHEDKKIISKPGAPPRIAGNGTYRSIHSSFAIMPEFQMH